MNKPVPRKPRLKLLGKDLDLVQIDDKARRSAIAVLEVLAGLRTVDQAAAALDISTPTYFALETRALRGLVLACTPSSPGRHQALSKQLRVAEEKTADLERQLQRYQALLRSAQRTVGLAVPPVPEKIPSGKRKAKKPAVRALRALNVLRRPDASPPVDPILPKDDAPGIPAPAGAGMNSA
jgi:hypothetical protein